MKGTPPPVVVRQADSKGFDEGGLSGGWLLADDHLKGGIWVMLESVLKKLPDSRPDGVAWFDVIRRLDLDKNRLAVPLVLNVYVGFVFTRRNAFGLKVLHESRLKAVMVGLDTPVAFYPILKPAICRRIARAAHAPALSAASHLRGGRVAIGKVEVAKAEPVSDCRLGLRKLRVNDVEQDFRGNLREAAVVHREARLARDALWIERNRIGEPVVLIRGASPSNPAALTPPMGEKPPLGRKRLLNSVQTPNVVSLVGNPDRIGDSCHFGVGVGRDARRDADGVGRGVVRRYHDHPEFDPVGRFEKLAGAFCVEDLAPVPQPSRIAVPFLMTVSVIV